MKVMVTGGCGFIGSEVVKQLRQRGHEVAIMDEHEGADFQMDITDASQTLKQFEGYDACIHLAAKIGGIGYINKFPATILDENNLMLSKVFNACVEYQIKRVVYISSSMIYENSHKRPLNEVDVPDMPAPTSAYGFSKFVGEWYCKAYWDQYKLPYTIIRPFNAYGVNEHPKAEPGYSHVIPDLTKKLLNGQNPLEIFGNGTQTRCFTHVRDVARGICMALESERAVNEDFNISSQLEMSVREVAGLIHKQLGLEGPLDFKPLPAFKHDVQHRLPGVFKASRLLGFQAQVQFGEGLDEVVEWLKETYANA